MTDHLQNFSLNNGEYRGTFVQLEHSYQQIIALHAYPETMSQLLGEALAAISLLGHQLKQNGKLALQLQKSAPIDLLIVEINHHRHIRGLIQWQQEALLKKPLQLHQGQFAMTMTPEQGTQYQGIVPITGGTLSESLTHYFSQSEQVFSRVLLAANDTHAAGLFIQKMPDFANSEFALSIDELHLLLNTINTQELLTDSPTFLFQKLFHEHDVTLFQAENIEFKCNCSQEKMACAVRLLGLEDAQDLLNTYKMITVTCEFCNHHYSFNDHEVASLFEQALSKH
jgi:molecular chaperone Hsp33